MEGPIAGSTARSPLWMTVAAGVVALGFGAVGLVWGTYVAGGADSYGYVSQADAWLNGHLTIEQPFSREVPWPMGDQAFTPLGYRPRQSDTDGTLVPIYSVGLPMLMAAAKAIGGYRGVFWVVPCLGVALIAATFAIGRRLGNAGAGLIGAWLVATSPVSLYMVVAPMTDIPVAAGWAMAFLNVLGTTWMSALAAGIWAGVAVLIRPNLVPLAAVLGVAYLLRPRRDPSWRRHALLYAAPVLASAVTIAIINTRLYGSPLRSGYAPLPEMFSWSSVSVNAPRYFRWFVETHTVAGLVGMVALLVPLRMWWPRARIGDVGLAAIVAVTVWVLYLAYLPFDAWWFLRFLLASWPFIMLGVGAVAMAVCRGRHWSVAALVSAAIIGLGAYQVHLARQRFAFDQWRAERKYIAAGQAVARLTGRDSVIIGLQHTGSLRYYGGRMTMRFEWIEPAWLDRVVDWLSTHNARPYLLLDKGEVADFRTRFAGARTLQILDTPPLSVYENNDFMLFDLASPQPPTGTPERITVESTGTGPVAPAPRPRLRLTK